MKTYLVSLFAFLLTLSSGMSDEPATATRAIGLQVEILIFSGRPNPVFTVTDPAEIRDILATANGLPQTPSTLAKSAAAAPVLGYRGMAVQNRSQTSPEVKSLVVNRSNVTITRDRAASSSTLSGANGTSADVSASEIRSDSAVSLENKLLALAQRKGAIDGNLLAAINSQRQ